MNIIALQHFEFDDIDVFKDWSHKHGHQLHIHDPSTGMPEELINSMDFLIILGGPMSAYEEDRYPWLIQEKEFIRQAIQLEKKILGICLGAQLLAELLGGKVYPAAHKEIGWHQVIRTEDRHHWFNEMPMYFHSFQWHGDTFDLPKGAKLLAYSEACEHQAFGYGDNILGLQFHLETTPVCLTTMLKEWSDEIVEGRYIQTLETIKHQVERCQMSFVMLRGLLDRMAGT
ncbi:type 1 glutamine amidotransferase [Cohnella abietis]|uniref:Amidotransferase n=1 Tax=Cohnella abietis TaxID=2507935 RepID=A0A3T1D422_9BACL|nr:type 1 glutamine amidotransferase [Cohnella abietis]BBI32788.1 amidotransferase [Cohnella abietis]